MVTLLTQITINELGHQAKCMLFLSDFNHNWNVQRGLSKNPQYQF